MRYLFLLRLLLGFALAQNLGHSEEVVRNIQGCETRLYFYTPWMASRAVAEALHFQITQNNLPVWVASSSQGLFAKTGIGLMGLGWAGARVFKVSTPEKVGVLLCEGRFGVVGPLVDHAEMPQGPSTRLIRDPTEVTRLAAWFRALLRGGLEVDAKATWPLMR